MRRRNVIAMSATLALVAGILAISPALRAKGNLRATGEHVSALLSEAKTEAVTLQNDTNRLMVNYAQLQVPLDAGKLAEIGRHAAEMEDLSKKLSAEAADAEPWQRDVIAQIAPLLKELAGNTNSALRFIDSEDTWLHEAEFDEYIAESYNLSKEEATLVASAVDFGRAKTKFDDAYGRFLNALMAGLG